MLERFFEQAERIVSEHKAQYKGVYYMKGGVLGGIENAIGKAWTPIRDAAETGAVLAGNYVLPGSSLLTSKVASQGSQKQLSSPLGEVGQIGSGLAGAGIGSSITGIPQSVGGAAEAGLLSSAGEAIGSGASSVGDALGITDAATAAPWVNPDIASASIADAGSTAAPWVNPDVAVAPGASAASASPFGSNLATDAFGNPIDAANPNNLTGNGINFGSTALANPAGSNLSDIATPAFTNDAGSPIGSSLASAVPAANAGTQAASSGGLWNSIKSAGSIAGPLISGTGLALAALKGSQPIPAETALNTQATQEAANGQQLQNYLPSGTLPPGAQAGIDQAKNSAKASIRSKYASMGMSGSSSEQQELSAIDSNAQAQGEQLALQLLNSGIQESQLSGQLYQNILNSTLEQDKNLSSSIGNFASSVAGGSKSPITVNV